MLLGQSSVIQVLTHTTSMHSNNIDYTQLSWWLLVLSDNNYSSFNLSANDWFKGDDFLSNLFIGNL